MASISSIDPHGADLGGEGRARAARHDDGGDQPADLAQHAHAQKIDGEDLGAEPLQLVGALIGQHDADQKGEQAHDRQGADAGLLHLMHHGGEAQIRAWARRSSRRFPPSPGPDSPACARPGGRTPRWFCRSDRAGVARRSYAADGWGRAPLCSPGRDCPPGRGSARAPEARSPAGRPAPAPGGCATEARRRPNPAFRCRAHPWRWPGRGPHPCFAAPRPGARFRPRSKSRRP